MNGRTETAVAPGLRSEAQLLLAVAGEFEESERTDRIRSLLEEDLDWDYLIRAAVQHRLSPQLYWHLNRTCPDRVPPPKLDLLRRHFRHGAVRNVFLMGELLEIVRSLGSSGIEALPYKGPLLASRYYSDLGLRHIWDLDFLVRRNDVLGAKSVLMDRGYRPVRELTPLEEAAFLETDCEYHFKRRDGRVDVEIHWQFLPALHTFGFDSEFVWDHVIRADFGGASVLTLPSEELFLVLCVHGG